MRPLLSGRLRLLAANVRGALRTASAGVRKGVGTQPIVHAIFNKLRAFLLLSVGSILDRILELRERERERNILALLTRMFYQCFFFQYLRNLFYNKFERVDIQMVRAFNSPVYIYIFFMRQERVLSLMFNVRVILSSPALSNE